MGEKADPVYKKNEKAVFAPASGECVDCQIIEVPREGERKYLISIEEGTEHGRVFTVNACYLRKKD